ncbi:hypothetical protein KY290_026068 [Solanum tuberosum]|uniref:Uncharacterized protein n=1 Tax=Solanum tuberosum TaxID=4113 RepID=A0ABQ7UXB7_SOLTU|nr:hypothetical protein KY289_025130 [Solanum tuberosum]KAH0677150.1 hypothetical protein KY285_024951 [Solanum tuberosum]KAH0755798.1 hypothetical protein KY290_026068 [Solanum tuberosum]
METGRQIQREKRRNQLLAGGNLVAGSRRWVIGRRVPPWSSLVLQFLSSSAAIDFGHWPGGSLDFTWSLVDLLIGGKRRKRKGEKKDGVGKGKMIGKADGGDRRLLASPVVVTGQQRRGGRIELWR